MCDARREAVEMWKTAKRFPHIPTARLQCLWRFSGLREKRWQIGMACVMVELSRQNQKAGATLSVMNQITYEQPFGICVRFPVRRKS